MNDEENIDDEFNDVCEWCEGVGVTYEDEYENGQIVGVGTVAKRCICRMKAVDDDTDPE